MRQIALLLALVVLLDKEVKENETLVLKPIAMIGEQEVPLLVSSNWGLKG